MHQWPPFLAPLPPKMQLHLKSLPVCRHRLKINLREAYSLDMLIYMGRPFLAPTLQRMLLPVRIGRLIVVDSQNIWLSPFYERFMEASEMISIQSPKMKLL